MIDEIFARTRFCWDPNFGTLFQGKPPLHCLDNLTKSKMRAEKGSKNRPNFWGPGGTWRVAHAFRSLMFDWKKKLNLAPKKKNAKTTP